MEAATLEHGLARVARLRAEGISLQDAARQVAKGDRLSQNELYDRALK